MSRIGKLPIGIPSGVKVNFTEDRIITVSGKLGELSQKVVDGIDIELDENNVIVKRNSDEKQDKSFHGLMRSLINNMIVGVSVGYEKKMELVGVGYRATSNGQLLEMHLGYSHPIVLQLPDQVSVFAETEKRKNSTIVLKSADKQLLGHVAAKIRSFRTPEPYKGKGIKFDGEILRRKAGKTAAGSK